MMMWTRRAYISPGSGALAVHFSSFTYMLSFELIRVMFNMNFYVYFISVSMETVETPEVGSEKKKKKKKKKVKEEEEED